MLDDLWKRPSLVVLGTTVVVVTAFVWRGDLGIARSGSSPGVGPVPPRSSGPVVVKPERSSLPPRQPATVAGRVYDAQGFLLVGADVLVDGRSMARSDADGAFRIALQDRLRPFLVQASGYQPSWLFATGLDSDLVCVQAVPAAPWDRPASQPAARSEPLLGEGSVRGIDGQPVVGAWVTAGGTGVWGRSDELGRFVVPLPGPAATLIVHQPDGPADGQGFAIRTAPLALGRERGRVPLPELVVEPAAALRGTLHDAGGNPVVGGAVQVSAEGWSRVVESGMSGMFRLAGLVPGEYRVRPLGFRGALGRPSLVTVDRPSVQCEVALQSSSERRLQVVDEQGAPVPRAHVASSFLGTRHAVGQADAEGWTSLRVADADAEFEVRGADNLAPWPVRRYEAEHTRLVVAAP